MKKKKDLSILWFLILLLIFVVSSIFFFKSRYYSIDISSGGDAGSIYVGGSIEGFNGSIFQRGGDGAESYIYNSQIGRENKNIIIEFISLVAMIISITTGSIFIYDKIRR